MARRKNIKRIDPRYFLNETTYRDELEEQGSFTTNMPDDVPTTAQVMQKMRDDGTAPEETPPEKEAPGKAKLDAILQDLPIDALKDPKVRAMILGAVDKVMKMTDPLE